MRRVLPLLALQLLLSLALAGAAAAAPSWRQVRVEPPPPPPGADPAQYDVPLGAIQDISFWAPNRGLIAVEGNNVVDEGLYVFDGQTWRQYARVCGGQTNRGRIAWAGPTEFWVTALYRKEVRAYQSSLAKTDSRGGNVTLCRFRDGRVEQSFATPSNDPQSFLPMEAAACSSPTDCWFGGHGFRGERQGAFHLHWDGSSLEQVAGQQGRGVSDLGFVGDRLYETTFLGDDYAGAAPRLTFPESPPKLLHRFLSGNFRNDPFTPRTLTNSGNAAVELHEIGVDGARMLVVGGPALGGPPEQRQGPRTGPVMGRLVAGAVQEVTLPSGRFSPDESFFDVAPIPGTDQAWVAVGLYDQRNSVASNRGRLVRLREDGMVLEDVQLPSPPAESQGPFLTVECAAADDCWAGNRAGWVWRWSEAGKSYPRDTEPAFNGPVIDDRPTDGSVPQFTPDTPPIDDSLRNAPPPPPPPAPRQARPRTRLPALIRGIRVNRRGANRLVISFTLTRPARVQFTGQGRRGRVVARTKKVTRKRGRHRLTMSVSRKRWPRRIRYSIRAVRG